MKLLKILFAVPKTLYVNFRVLPFRQAVKLPIWVTCQTRVAVMGGGNPQRQRKAVLGEDRIPRM